MINTTKNDAKAIDIRNRYSSHVADREGQEKMRSIRRHVRALADAIEILCPDGRPKSTALTHLDSVMFSANASIAQTYPVDENDI